MKYKVKDINKNGKIDGWEQAKYDAINKSSDSPTKQVVDPTMQQQMVQPMTNIPPAPSNTMGVAKPVFSQQAQSVAQGVYGAQPMLQNAAGAPFMYKDGSPLEGNAFIGAKMAAEKAGKDTFEVGGKTFQVK